MGAEIQTRKQGNTGEIVFRNPENNHASFELLSKIGDALDAFAKDIDVRAIVLAADGKPFCAGADLVSDGPMREGTFRPVVRFYRQAIRLFASPKPIVVAVQGAAVGAGLGLALVGDFRVASTEARFVANFVKLGFHPGFGLTRTLPRLIGEHRASLVLLSGDRFKPEDVLPWGLVDEVCAPGELRARAHAFAARIAENAPLALLETRRNLRRGLVADVTSALAREARAQSRLRPTEDYREGIRAVTERRPGRFVGR